MSIQNIEVPTYMVGELKTYMEQLAVQKKKRERVKPKPEQCEVKEIINHRITGGQKWQFLIVFSDRATSWVDDEDCDCEYLIGLYLKSVNINTAYIICRVSTMDQAKSTNVSLEAQESEIQRTLIEMRKTNPRINNMRVRVYKVLKSAYRNIPPTLIKIGEALLNGDFILVWRIDRLSRNIIKYLDWLEDLDERGVNIFAHCENINYHCNKMLFIQYILDAQKEAIVLGNRVKLANKRKRERGDEAIGTLEYGKKYRRILSRNKLYTIRKVVANNPHERHIINRIIKKKRKGESAVQIANELNDHGFTKRGRKWSKSMIQRLVNKHRALA